MSSQQRAYVAAVIAVVGLLALAAGVIYLTVEAKSLPSFMGQISGDHAHRSLRGIVALIVGVLLLAGSAGLLAYRPGRASP
jgi:amino acid permease